MERLIEEVRKYPILYDQRHEKYRNTDYKERLWNTIATQLGTHGKAKSIFFIFSLKNVAY